MARDADVPGIADAFLAALGDDMAPLPPEAQAAAAELRAALDKRTYSAARSWTVAMREELESLPTNRRVKRSRIARRAIARAWAALDRAADPSCGGLGIVTVCGELDRSVTLVRPENIPAAEAAVGAVLRILGDLLDVVSLAVYAVQLVLASAPDVQHRTEPGHDRPPGRQAVASPGLAHAPPRADAHSQRVLRVA